MYDNKFYSLIFINAVVVNTRVDRITAIKGN